MRERSVRGGENKGARWTGRVRGRGSVRAGPLFSGARKDVRRVWRGEERKGKEIRLHPTNDELASPPHRALVPQMSARRAFGLATSRRIASRSIRLDRTQVAAQLPPTRRDSAHSPRRGTARRDAVRLAINLCTTRGPRRVVVSLGAPSTRPSIVVDGKPEREAASPLRFLFPLPTPDATNRRVGATAVARASPRRHFSLSASARHQQRPIDALLAPRRLPRNASLVPRPSPIISSVREPPSYSYAI